MKISEKIVEAAKNGDKESFAILYDSVKDDLYKLALYNLGNPHDAEDAVSETFVEAYKGISGIRDSSSFKAWIMRILYIRCKRKISDYIKDRHCLDIDELVDLTDEKDDMESSISQKIAVISALNQLGNDEKNIVILSVVHGYTTKEISKIMNIPHGTVSSKLYRTYGKLRKILTEKEVNHEKRG